MDSTKAIPSFSKSSRARFKHVLQSLCQIGTWYLLVVKGMITHTKNSISNFIDHTIAFTFVHLASSLKNAGNTYKKVNKPRAIDD